jgi:hypothetical protein
VIEVLDATEARPKPEEAARWRLERPRPGSWPNARALRVAGWVLPQAGRVAAVELMNGRRLIAQADSGLARPDVASRFPDLSSSAATAGFRGDLNLIALWGELSIDVRAVLDHGSRVQLGSFRVRRLGDGPGVDAALVSVVIPCYNQAHYLGEAIASVLAQTHPELEVIVVDDGSGDNAEEVTAHYPGVRCIRQENQGAAAARNRGFAEARGAYVVFLDADDRLLPAAVKVGLEALADHPEAGFAAGACRDIGPDGARLPSPEQPLVTRDHYAALLESCFIWSGSSVIYRREALSAVGGFDERRAAGDDYELYLNIARRFPVVCHDAIVTEYRRHGLNMTRDPRLILASQVDVLRAQRGQPRTRAERRARRVGIRNTKREEGEALADELSSLLRRRDLRGASRTALALARWYPRGLLVALSRLARGG